MFENEIHQGECAESKNAQLALTAAIHDEGSIMDSQDSNFEKQDAVEFGSRHLGSREEIENFALLETKHSRAQFLFMMLASLGVATGVTLKPRESFAKGPELSTDTLEIQLYRQGGPDWRWLFNWMQATNNANGPLKSPPSGQAAAPNNYLMVPNPDGSIIPVHFLQKWGDQSMVILSDHETNSHSNGTQRAFTGSDAMNMPSIDAMRAAAFGHGSPFSLLTSGGLTFPAGLVAPNSTGNINTLLGLADPTITNPNNPNSDRIVPQGVAQKLQDERTASFEQISTGKNFKGKTLLPSVRSIGEKRLTAQSAAANMKKFLKLVQQIQASEKDPLYASALIATELFKLGYVAGVTLQHGGYDTHGEMNGAKQMANNQTIMLASDKILSNWKANGVKGRIALIGDFGRRAAGQGDPSAHHHVGSAVFIGEGIKGPRVIGKVNENLELIGEKNNYADVTSYRRQLNGLDQVDFGINTKLTEIKDPNLIKNLIAQQTGGVYREGGRPLDRRELFSRPFKKMFT